MAIPPDSELPARGGSVSSLETLTHARLRAAQGDHAGAEALLRRMLERDPGHAEARELLRSVEGGGAPEPEGLSEEALLPPQPGDPARLASSFREALSSPEPPGLRRIRRLRAWLGRILRDP